MKKIILASQSPRRKELLALITEAFDVMPADIDETVTPGISPEDYVLRMSQQKAAHIFKEYPESLVIGCDTVVVLDGEILGKPVDHQEAKEMLQRYSDRTHEVLTGLTLLSKDKQITKLAQARVTFYPLDEAQIDAYVATNEPMDKAGAYGIQGGAAVFVKEIIGDYYAIVGFPVGLVNECLKSF
ncbi:Maf family protein [Vagococcus xieshaowenii]|uniref:dTTP/UTP pyrophosphatase n=1 Tax=Vagococcus xieshaowenii TaxID=2562451 RepID=A0AAJ5ED99_9ENTE|nr:Maf family protein [Vagococcus xieshaowenii]QCA29362.1 septum formation inhibitor Maf [Vagococcus xieshaowenii]TFZ39346.1 septum formation inhibitor Maf [Vagococcus xieshaowenii]